MQDLETEEAQFCKMFYWKKELEMLSRQLKNFGMKEVKAMVDDWNAFEAVDNFLMKEVTALVDAYTCDGDMAKKQSVSSFDWAER